ncbi:MAG: hypothetical protein WBS19_08580 [Candidatus Korobacteraceae bacterium]
MSDTRLIKNNSSSYYSGFYPCHPCKSVVAFVLLESNYEAMLLRLLKQAATVILGSLFYFFVLMPHLPPAARHEPYHLDWGLLIDAWICLVLYGLIELISRRKP